MTSINESAKLVSAADLLKRPDDGYRYELVRGQLVRDSPPGYEHGSIVANLSHLILTWVRRQQTGSVTAGDAGYRLYSDPDTVRAPDVAFVSRSRLHGSEVPRGYWEGAPDLAVEVVSPHDRMVDVLAKVRDYLESGVQQVWIVVPQSKTITVHRSIQDVSVLTEDDTLVGDGPIEGLEIEIAEIFA